MRDRGNGLKAQPVVYRWTNGAGWVNPTSYEAMRMKAVNHKPMIRPEGTLALLGRGGGQLNLGKGLFSSIRDQDHPMGPLPPFRSLQPSLVPNVSTHTTGLISLGVPGSPRSIIPSLNWRNGGGLGPFPVRESVSRGISVRKCNKRFSNGLL